MHPGSRGRGRDKRKTDADVRDAVKEDLQVQTNTQMMHNIDKNDIHMAFKCQRSKEKVVNRAAMCVRETSTCEDGCASNADEYEKSCC